MFGTKNIEHKKLTEENILAEVSDYDIFNYYIGDIRIGKMRSSPLRSKDEHASFGIFVSKGDGRLVYNDYLLGGGTCFKFVQELFSVDYWSALNIINNDMKLGLAGNSKITKINKEFKRSDYKPKPKEQIKLAIKKRKWDTNDGLYWRENYWISLKTLQHFGVYPISHYFVNGSTVICSPIAYAYHLDRGVYKIYEPHLPVNQGKFFTNLVLKTPWQGAKQLPKEGGDLLFITSSLKDVMVLHELGYHAMAPHTEHQIFNDKIYEYYSSRWKRIVIFYDHDKAGIKHSEKWKEKYGMEYITTGSDFAKDPSDYAKFNSLALLGKLIKDKL